MRRCEYSYIRIATFCFFPFKVDLSPFSCCSSGDCDNDSECQGSLICHQRDAFEEIPGCIGGRQDSSLTDYCIDPNGLSDRGATVLPTITPSTPLPTMALIDTPKPTRAPTGNPQIIYVGNNNPYWYPLPLCVSYHEILIGNFVLL